MISAYTKLAQIALQVSKQKVSMVLASESLSDTYDNILNSSAIQKARSLSPFIQVNGRQLARAECGRYALNFIGHYCAKKKSTHYERASISLT